MAAGQDVHMDAADRPDHPAPHQHLLGIDLAMDHAIGVDDAHPRPDVAIDRAVDLDLAIGDEMPLDDHLARNRGRTTRRSPPLPTWSHGVIGFVTKPVEYHTRPARLASGCLVHVVAEACFGSRLNAPTHTRRLIVVFPQQTFRPIPSPKSIPKQAPTSAIPRKITSCPDSPTLYDPESAQE